MENNNGESFCHPHVAILGAFSDNAVCLAVAEGTCLSDAEKLDPYTGIIVAFAAYYIFSVSYPPKLAATLEFIQRYVLVL